MLELQILAVVSADAVSTEALSEEKTADLTRPEWPANVSRQSPVLGFQILAVVSADAVSTEAPSEEKTADHTQPVAWAVVSKPCLETQGANFSNMGCRLQRLVWRPKVLDFSMGRRLQKLVWSSAPSSMPRSRPRLL